MRPSEEGRTDGADRVSPSEPTRRSRNVNSTKKGRALEMSGRSSPGAPDGDLADLLWLGDHGKNPHRGRTTRTDQRIDFVHLSDELGLPQRAALRAPPVCDMCSDSPCRRQNRGILRRRAAPEQKPVGASPSTRQGQGGPHGAYSATCSWFAKHIARSAGYTVIRGAGYVV